MPRRKPGTLLPLEIEILEAALSIHGSENEGTFHGFGLAQSIREGKGFSSLTGHGTLYKALGRLEEFGLLISHWEDPASATGRPPRRLYELTSQGIDVAQKAAASKVDHPSQPSHRIAPDPT